MSTIDVLVDMIENFLKKNMGISPNFQGAKVRVMDGVIKWNFFGCEKACFPPYLAGKRLQVKNILPEIFMENLRLPIHEAKTDLHVQVFACTCFAKCG
jgi:hypothetical protein